MAINARHNRSLENRRMFGKNFLNFHGSNVLATRDDDIFCAILEFNIPIRMPNPQSLVRNHPCILAARVASSSR